MAAPVKEHDIRPKDLFDRYLELARKDSDALLAKKAAFERVDCPGCGARDPEPGLVKDGYAYVLCRACGSLYLDPRPTAAQMDEFYATAASVEFWSTDFYAKTEEARRERLFKPRADLVTRLAGSLGLPKDAALCDVGCGYGIFLEEARAAGRFKTVAGIEPAAALAATCRKKGFAVVEKTVEKVGPGEVAADLATCFEVLEHAHAPVDFLKAARRVLKPGGRLLATTLVCTGFDIAVLWERSRSVHPPHHINLLSVDGIRKLFARAGYEIETLETPGRLDVDIVKNALKDDPALPLPRFVRSVLASDDAARAAFQESLAKSLLSSHVRVVARAA